MFTIFSALDDRARAKGSRDPLGAEATWSFLGRKVVGNLTTVTANLDNFMVALLCCAHANEQVTDPATVRERYLRAEQVAAYLKLAADKGSRGFLGITQAKKNFEQAKIPLGTSARAQLLASQAAYGLWGLYSSALEGAGLIAGASRRPTPAGTAVIYKIKEQLGEVRWAEFVQMTAGDNLVKSAILASGLASAFWGALTEPALRSMAVNALLAFQHGGAMQQELFFHAQAYLALDRRAEHRSMDFCDWVLTLSDSTPELKTALKRIQAVDPVLKFADSVLAWLQKKNGEPMMRIEQELQAKMPAMDWCSEWQQETKLPHREFLMRLQSAAQEGSAAKVIDAVLAQNRVLMRARGGAAWIEAEGANLIVRVSSDHQNSLDVLRHLGEQWRFTYFVSAFLSITEQGLA